MTGWTGGELRGDCERCFGLCCVAPAFAASADFAISKRAGQACRNLDAGFRCSIHERLLTAGFPGCAAYDCFGAGQRVSRGSDWPGRDWPGRDWPGRDWPGRDWHSAPEAAGEMFAVFAVVRELHELAWHLEQALALDAAEPVRAELSQALARTGRLASGPAATVVRLDLGEHFKAVGELLAQASALARAAAPGAGPDLRGADLAGRDLRGSDLAGASLRWACLIGADLRGADLRLADFTGADLRGADLRGTDLRAGLFLTQVQLSRALGDAATVVPPGLTRPGHWDSRPAGWVRPRPSQAPGAARRLSRLP